MRKRVFKTVSAVGLLIILLALCEATAYYILIIKNANFYLPPRYSPSVLDGLRACYSYELGWEPKQQNRFGYRGPLKTDPAPILSVFGDSFARGHDTLEKSWPYLLEQKLKQPVLNFGVAGYGTDQAFWRFEKHYGGEVKSTFVCLAVMSENIARVVNLYRSFLSRKNEVNLTKPAYYREADGDIVLLENPLKSADEVEKLNDPAFLEKIGQKDYWYWHYDKYGLNRRAHFPYAYYLARGLPYYIQRYYQMRIKNGADYKILYQQAGATGILRHILELFTESAKAQQARPVILFFPTWKDIVDYTTNGKTVYNDFYQTIKNMHADTLDAIDFFAPYLAQGQRAADLFISYDDGHYNPHGEAIVAEGFYRYFKTRMKMEREGSG